MELAIGLVVLAIAIVAFIHYSHSALATKLRDDFDTRFTALKTEVKPKVAALEAEPAINEAVETVRQSVEELHAKVDAVRAKIGGAITDAEKSEAFKEAEAKVEQLKAMLAAGHELMGEGTDALETLLKMKAAVHPPT